MSVLKALRLKKIVDLRNISTIHKNIGRKLCNNAGNIDNEIPTKVESGGYAKSYEKFEHLKDEEKHSHVQTFEALLKNSKFIDLGDPEGKIVNGKIFHIVDDDLYIDFGWKFHCVCPRPKKNPSGFVRGATVRLLIKDLELSTKFLGFDKDLTLLEADCTLLGLAQDRSKSTSQQ